MDCHERYPDPALQTFLMGRYISWFQREVRCFVPYLPLFFHISGYLQCLNQPFSIHMLNMEDAGDIL